MLRKCARGGDWADIVSVARRNKVRNQTIVCNSFSELCYSLQEYHPGLRCVKSDRPPNTIQDIELSGSGYKSNSSNIARRAVYPQGLKGYHHTNLKGRTQSPDAVVDCVTALLTSTKIFSYKGLDNRQENPATATCTNKTPVVSPQVLHNPAEEAEVTTMLFDANGRLRGAKRRRPDESDSEDRPVRDLRRLCLPGMCPHWSHKDKELNEIL